MKKIDQYRAQHMEPWLVVCCRQDEYAELVADDSALEGVDAVVLQPLTPVQIKGNLTVLEGAEPRRLWGALHNDDVLLELADTPLMLNVMLLAAEQLDWSTLPSNRGREAVRSNIYDAYIRSMLARPRNASSRYPDGKTLKWLHWLAGKMVAHGQTVFLLERMKRSWFNQPWQRLSWVLIGVLIGGLLVGLVGGLLAGLILGLYVGLVDISDAGQYQVRLNRGNLLLGLRNGLRWGLFVGLICGLLYGLCVGLPDMLLAGLIYGPLVILPFTLFGGLLFGLVDGLFEFSTTIDGKYSVKAPGIVIHQTLRSGLIIGLIIGLLFGLLFGMLRGLFREPSPGLIGGLSAGLIFGLIFGWAYVIKHYTLRLVLFLDGSMPLNYVRFLDYCVDCVLLRRVGGGYMFIHRTMMEHIAGLDLEKWKEQPDSP